MKWINSHIQEFCNLQRLSNHHIKEGFLNHHMYFVICSHGNWNSYRLTMISQNACIIHTNPSMCTLVVFFARNKLLLLLCTNSLLFKWLTSFSCFCMNTHDIINAVVIWLSRKAEIQKEPCIHYQIEICSKW